ncbi:pelargonidin 3-O-(6-caffeoylglucoside) 5-O-(6-O-malonylglucoside) 4'''-malonyltransferase-like [Salvia divinorum]|uniref:Pelargonidin 3-O-(6-caffeoylglucoside) 5-O-(6-O-malonylglucoside) 4'''-malonyltransferase-like n=1 Tax=Salvia divinorum TaxID=28513 RepID=A0ABD1I1Q2_SALDI
MKVEVQSRHLVKPATATPSHLRRYKISMIDDLNPPMHVIRILYYPPHSPTLNLQPPLSQILPSFYPLAGRYLKPLHAVDCNDAGALYSSTHTSAPSSPTPPSPPPASTPSSPSTSPPPTAPTTPCWPSRSTPSSAAASPSPSAPRTGSSTHAPSPSLFPSESAAPLDFGVGERRIVGKRIVFDKKAISTLRARANSDPGLEGVTLSRVVVVSAALTQALLRADEARHAGGSTMLHTQTARATLIAHAINVRERTVPPVPKHACGTWVSISHVELGAAERREAARDFPKLAREMREATVRGIKDCARILSEKEFGRWALVDSYAEIAEKGLIREGYKVIYETDWSKFGDYELDFGCGKAIWVSLADVPLEDLMILMNTRENDGIEAWVYLDESDMAYFEKDQHIQMLLA